MATFKKGQYKKVLFHLYQKHDGCCFYCRKETAITNSKTDPIKATVDHFIPKSRNGRNSKKNFVLSCLSCNQKKGSRNPMEFLRAMHDEYRQERLVYG